MRLRFFVFVFGGSIVVGCGQRGGPIPDSSGEAEDGGTTAADPTPGQGSIDPPGATGGGGSASTEDSGATTPMPVVTITCGTTACASTSSTPACCLQVYYSEFIGVAPTSAGKCQSTNAPCAWDGDEWHQAVRLTCATDNDCVAPARCREQVAGHTRSLACSTDEALLPACAPATQCPKSARSCRAFPGTDTGTCN